MPQTKKSGSLLATLGSMFESSQIERIVGSSEQD